MESNYYTLMTLPQKNYKYIFCIGCVIINIKVNTFLDELELYKIFKQYECYLLDFILN